MTVGTDLDWLGMERTAPGQWRFTVAPHLGRPDGKFYGGTGLAVVVAAMEAETSRAALWATAQFVASNNVGDEMQVRVRVLAAGRRSSQVQVEGWSGEILVFAGLGSTGTARHGFAAAFGTMPDVAGPYDCDEWTFPTIPMKRVFPGWLEISEGRVANRRGDLWMRARGRGLSRAAMAFMADTVPNAVMRAAGRAGAGTSLDNSIRFGPPPTGDWMLFEVDPYMVSGGYCHGQARLWSADGELLGVASQTASVLLFD